jgi:hypothetical protein
MGADRDSSVAGRSGAARRAWASHGWRGLVGALLGLAGLLLVGTHIAQNGGRVFENPACVPESAPSCGARSDIFPRLVGTRLVWERTSPYEDNVFAVVSTYLTPENANNQRFYYPVPFAVVLSPLAVLPYGWAGAVFTWVTCLAFVLLLAMILRRCSGGRVSVGVALFASGVACTYSRLFGTALGFQQPALLLAAFFAGMCVAMLYGRWVAVGVLAALMLVKPQFAIAPAAIALVALAVFDRSRRGLIAFGATLGGLLVASFALVPGWIGDFLDEVDFYERANPTASVLATAGAGGAAAVAFGVLITLLLAVGVVWLREARDAGPSLVLAASAAMAASLLAVPRIPLFIGPYDHQALLVAAAALGGLAVAGRHRVLAAVTLVVPLLAVVSERWLGRSADWVVGANDVLDALGGFAVPSAVLGGGTVGDTLLGTVGTAVAVWAGLWVALVWPVLARLRPRLAAGSG